MTAWMYRFCKKCGKLRPMIGGGGHPWRCNLCKKERDKS